MDKFFKTRTHAELIKIKFTLSFVSLIFPHDITNLTPLLSFLAPNSKKIYLKQSYLILSWFYYLSFIETPKNKKDRKPLKLVFLPNKINKFTAVKSPLCNKTRSKEQFKFQVYRILYCFKSYLEEDNRLISLNEATLFILITKKNFPIMETNLLFLKNYKINFFYKDKSFFSY